MGVASCAQRLKEFSDAMAAKGDAASTIAEAAVEWTNVWNELIGALVVPSGTSPALALTVFNTALEANLNAQVEGLQAISDAAMAGMTVFAADIISTHVMIPPPVPLFTTLGPALAAPAADSATPANTFATVTAAWIGTALWSIKPPPPPVFVPFVVQP